MKKYRILTLIIASLLTFSLCSCIFQPQDADGAQGVETDTNGNVVSTQPDSTIPEVEDEKNDEANTSEFTASISFTANGCEISDTDAVVNSGKIYKIVKAGTYRITGTMEDGQIQVEVADTDRVTLLLDNFDGKCSDSAVIYVVNADRVYIDLEKGSVNTLTDASEYKFANPADDKPNACIYSSDDLTIKGGGRLNVYANWNKRVNTL